MNEVTKCDLKPEDIIHLALDANLLNYVDLETPRRYFIHADAGVEEIERFASLIAAHEREACAKVCEEVRDGFLNPRYATGQPLSSIRERFAAGQCAEAIRARSET